VLSEKLNEARKNAFANVDNSNLVSVVQDLQKEVSALQQQNIDLQQQNIDLQNKIISLQQQNIDQQKEIISLQLELHVFKSDVTVLKTKYHQPFPVKACVVCGAYTRAKCSRCSQVYYCSPACQKLHWDEHRKTCKEAIIEIE